MGEVQISRHDGKKLWRNTTDGLVGAVVYKPNGEEKGVAVEPRAKIWLSDEEVELTTHAHRNEADSPFADHDFESRDDKSGEVIESGRRPLLVPVMKEVDEDVEDQAAAGGSAGAGPGATQVAGGPSSDQAPPGSYAPGEEPGGAHPEPQV